MAAGSSARAAGERRIARLQLLVFVASCLSNQLALPGKRYGVRTKPTARRTLRVGGDRRVEVDRVWGHKEKLVTHLRKLMLEELQRRNYSQTTVTSYIKTLADFAKYFHRPVCRHYSIGESKSATCNRTLRCLSWRLRRCYNGRSMVDFVL